jgi:[pyruvate, water dikinase]-phosphate phosphotransferase / [pyruvate, water dikinase] kinase
MRDDESNPQSTVLVISDSTGNLARHMLTAVLTQFPPHSISVWYENFVRTSERLKSLMQEAKARKAVVCHAMVFSKLKSRIKKDCAAARLRCYDLTGGLVTFLEQSSRVASSDNVLALHQLDESYRRRIGAMEFTLSHDDGLGLDTLHEADVVLVGVSRTSKTPTSILLAQQGYLAANVSLALGVRPPAQLLAVPKRKIVGLTISPSQLVVIRARRQIAWGMPQTDYGRPDQVEDEVSWCRSLFREHGWSTLDVTDQAVEETAAKVISIIGPANQQSSSMADVMPN